MTSIPTDNVKKSCGNAAETDPATEQLEQQDSPANPPAVEAETPSQNLQSQGELAETDAPRANLPAEQHVSDAGSETPAVSGADRGSVILLTVFGIGPSYLFNAVRGKTKTAEDCWREIFGKSEFWNFEHFNQYDKPLGETATLAFKQATHSDASAIIENLKIACATDLLADVDTNHIETSFFTTGVAVLAVRLIPKDLENTHQLMALIHEEEKLKAIRDELQKIIECSRSLYLDVLEKAASDTRPCSKKGWSLNRFKEVDRENWRPKSRHSYPLFFAGDDAYQTRIDSILQQVSSGLARRRQSDSARVSYQGSEIYVDWSEALVKSGEKSERLIENNFIIALASWFALILMNKNSSFFLFEALVGIVEKKHLTNATALRQRNMAYKDVSDASLPIRWTTRRRDLFLLETIHRNWSSKRWRDNIEERMKLVALHYQSLEDESNERSGRMLALAATLLALFTLSSAIADVMGLAENDGQPSRWIFLGFPLKEIDMYISFLPVVIAIPLAILWALRAIKAKRFTQ